MLLVTPAEQGPARAASSAGSGAGAATAREAKRAMIVENCILKENFAWYLVTCLIQMRYDGDDERKIIQKKDKGLLFMPRTVGSISRVSHEYLFCFVEHHCHRFDS
jgi:hypothetical protein